MTEQEWLASDDVYTMCQVVKCDRKLRLFAVASCRSIWHLINSPIARKSVEVAERFADELASKKELIRAWSDTNYLTRDHITWAVASTAFDMGISYTGNAANAAFHVAHTISNDGNIDFSEASFAQCNLLRNIVNPFHKPITPSEHARNLANVIYKSKDWQALTVLADMLEEEGCTNTTLLDHLRTTEQVYRGWWSLDLVRGI